MLRGIQIKVRGISVVSFSFEIVSPVANAAARTKGARTDNGLASEGFGALVDSNAADAAPADNPATTDRGSPIQRSDETRPAPASERNDPRDAQTRTEKAAADKKAADKSAADEAAADKIARDNRADAASDANDTSAPTGTPVVKTAAEADVDIAADLLTTDLAIAADIPTDAATDVDAQVSPDQTTAVANLLTVTAQTGIVPVVAPVAISTETTSGTAAATGVASIAAAAIATVAATVEADAPVTPTPATPALTTGGEPIAANATATTQADAEVSAELAASIDTPLTSEEQALLADAARIAANAKAAGTAASGETAIDAEAEASPQIKVETGISAKVETAQSQRKPAAEPDAASGIIAANADNSAETIVKPERSETTVAASPESRAHQTGTQDKAADADIPVQTSAKPPTQTGTPTVQPHIQPTVAAAATVAPALNASVQLASNVAVPLSSLAVNIALNANAGRSSFDIRLDPAELGRIDVRLDVDRQGNVTSHLTVERPATLDLLRRDAPQLQRALEDAGLKTGDNGLQFSLRDQSQQKQRADDDQSQRNSYRLVIDDVTAIPAEAGRTYARLAAARGGVDIRI